MLSTEGRSLSSDDLNLDQSGTGIQILPEPNAGHMTRFFFNKITTLVRITTTLNLTRTRSCTQVPE